MTRFRNYTDIADDEVRALYRAVCPPGIGAHDVRISNGDRFRGRAYTQGSGYHATARPFIVCAIPKTERRARLILPAGRNNKGYLAMTIGGRREALVVLLSHELRHLWQATHSRGRVYGARGRMSERDADAYALRMLRRYRRGEL